MIKIDNCDKKKYNKFFGVKQAELNCEMSYYKDISL